MGNLKIDFRLPRGNLDLWNNLNSLPRSGRCQAKQGPRPLLFLSDRVGKLTTGRMNTNMAMLYDDDGNAGSGAFQLRKKLKIGTQNT